MMTHNKQARSKDLADGSNRQVTLASVWSMTAVVFKRGSSDDETRPTSLMDSLIFSVQSRSCSNGRWSCRTDASKADLIKEESWHQQPSIAHVASHYFGLDNLLLEGVADRDLGITSTMAMVALTGKSCFRIFILQIIIFGILATHKQHTNRAVDCSTRERSKILYLGTVRIIIPKLKYSTLSFVHTFL